MLAIWAAVRAFAPRVPWQAWVALIAVASLALALLWANHAGYEAGASGATQEIKDANDAARDKADAGATNVDGCYDRGGEWDRAHGVCVNTPR